MFGSENFLFTENFLQNVSLISETLFVKTVLPYLIDNHTNTYLDKLKRVNYNYKYLCQNKDIIKLIFITKNKKYLW